MNKQAYYGHKVGDIVTMPTDIYARAYGGFPRRLIAAKGELRKIASIPTAVTYTPGNSKGLMYFFCLDRPDDTGERVRLFLSELKSGPGRDL